MPQFFIKRPVFAWVIALFIVLAGVIAIPQLPIARYPSVAPPSVSLYASYPGATPQTLNDSVVTLVERELSGVKNLLYFESSVDTSGSAQITATFKPGTDPELAQVDVQNRIKSVEPRLPQAVRQNGLQVESAASGFLMMVGMTSPGGQFDEVALNDYLARNVVPELRRIEGVGRVQLFGAEQAMRVWVDPDKLTAYNLTMNDLAQAIEQQNVQIAPGRIGDEPALPGQRLTVPLTVQGQLTTPAQFAAIVLRAGVDASQVLLGDVARVELGAQSYAFANRENGVPATSAAIQLAPGGNAVRTAAAVRERLAELAANLPAGMAYSVPFDTAPFVKLSIEKVIYTLLEAMLLVFLVMYLFLQNLRYTLIPAIVAPIALLGTFALMLVAGFSINSLTMFGMVLAIGIIVDDAIVVVENVERLMVSHGLSPREATAQAMREITGAVIGITLVLTAVFIPMAFASGSVGVIYQQFALAMAVSILFSALLALSLTPALCATLLRPVAPDHHHKRGFFGAFNRAFERFSAGYSELVRRLLGRSGRMMVAFAVICALLTLAVWQLPSSFLPEEDQGYFMTSIQLPTGATSERTLDVVKAFEAHVATRPALDVNLVVQGFSFSGSGPNAAMAFTMLKDWGQRNGASASEEAALAQQAMADSVEGTVMSLMPPAIDELGTSAGFTLYLQDRANRGEAALLAAQARLLALAARSKAVSDVYSDGLPPGASIRLEIDRQKAEAMGLSFAAVSNTLSAAMGSLYVNDFPNAGRMQQVILQADAPARMQLDDVLALRVRNAGGGMVALREVVRAEWAESPQQMMRFQGFPAVRIAGGAAPGVSSGTAMAEMERLAAQLPAGFAVAWSGQSLQERQSAAQAPLLMLLSALVVFLVLAALYESWSIPLAVLLVVPLGLLGAVLAVILRGMPNDVFFKVGMVTIIGLSAKNAILIVEFARQLHAEGRPLVDAAVTAARMRLRPILMTSLAFTLGVLPLMLARGASAESQHAIGTGVFGGMLSGTLLAVFFVPAFFVFVIGTQERIAAWRAPRGTSASTGEKAMIRLLLSLFLIGGLAACSLTPLLELPPSPVPASFSLATEAAPAGPPGWRAMFGDPRLQRLIELALQRNRDLRLAALNVQATKEMANVQRAGLLPSVGLGATQTRERGLTTDGGDRASRSPSRQAEVNVVVSAFELDLFGRVRALSDAALARYLASEHGRDAVHIALVGAVAEAYFAQQLAVEQRQLLESMLADWQQSLALARLLKQAEQSSSLDVAQAEAQAALAEAELEARRRAEAQAANALQLLVGGELPGDLPAALPLAGQPLIARLPAGLPSALLLHRPDLRQAEQMLVAANADIGAARAAFFPQISLTASFGYASSALGGLFDPGQQVWRFAPQLSQPLFQGGRLRAELRLAEVRKSEAVAQYERAIQNAFREVADALAGTATFDRQIAAQQRAMDAAEHRLALSRQRYQAGLDGRLELLDAQRQFDAARQAMLALRHEEIANRVALYKALGGGLGAHAGGSDAAVATPAAINESSSTPMSRVGYSGGSRSSMKASSASISVSQ